MAGTLGTAANALVLPALLWLVLALHPGIDLNGSGNIVWVMLRQDQAARDWHFMATLRCRAGRLNCERYRQVCSCCASAHVLLCLCCPMTAARTRGASPRADACLRGLRACAQRTSCSGCGTQRLGTLARAIQNLMQFLGLRRVSAQWYRSSLLHRRQRGQVR